MAAFFQMTIEYWALDIDYSSIKFQYSIFNSPARHKDKTISAKPRRYGPDNFRQARGLSQSLDDVPKKPDQKIFVIFYILDVAEPLFNHLIMGIIDGHLDKKHIGCFRIIFYFYRTLAIRGQRIFHTIHTFSSLYNRLFTSVAHHPADL